MLDAHPLSPLASSTPVRGLIWTGLLLGSFAFVLVGAAAGVVIWQTRSAILTQAETDVAEDRRLLVEQTHAFLAASDATLQLVAERIAAGTLTPFGSEAERQRTHSALNEMRLQFAQLDSLAVVDENGFFAVTSQSWPTPRRNLSAMPEFGAVATGGEPGMRIGAPSRRQEGNFVFHLWRPLHDSSGRFRGAVIATIDTSVLEEIYAMLDPGAESSVVLFRTDGVRMARFPHVGPPPGLPMPAETMRDAASPDRGLVQYSRTGGKLQLSGVQRVHDLPLVLQVTRCETRLLARWRQLALLTVGLAAASMAAIAAMTWLLVRRSRAQQRWALALGTARSRAEDANRAKSEFLAHMSHELRTPLNAVLGFADLIRQQLVPTRAHEYGESIHHAGAHLLALVNDLLDLHRIEGGTYPLERQRVEAAAALDDALGLVAPLAERRGVRLSRDAVATPETVFADPKALRQCLFNLLGNAIKFTPPGGRVDASVATLDADRVRFSIRDEGLGISAAELDRIFEPFQCGNASVANQQRGAGLGLAITKRLAGLHDGELVLASVEGRGTTAMLDLPRTA
ncbi:MAG: hypothetical protein JWM77_2818 [Rhodospirillales bacterium]|nr:hypothetical protein [Rhodospirillales bacterium]